MRLALAALALVACGVPINFVPRQDEAIRVAWSSHGAPGLPPTVRWRFQDQLDCYPSEGRNLGWRDQWGRCVAGLYDVQSRIADVAFPMGYELTQTALAHELYHAALATGYAGAQWADGDPMHAAPGWSTALAVANEALAVAGF